MGGTGKFFPKDFSPEKLKKEIRETERKTADSAFESKVSSEINKLLVDFNNRDVEATNRHLETIKQSIEKEIEGSIDVRFGGSVQKHTYVDGLSDIDSLVSIDKSDLVGKSPQEVLSYFYARLRQSLPNTNITKGDLAVTVKFADGEEIQLLPALKSGDKYMIATPQGSSWSKVSPKNFINALKKVNDLNKSKLIPTIKLIKGINSKFPKYSQLSGYHIESLSIEIFKKYAGVINTKSMLQHFFEQGKELVKSPIKDKTGQSVHVDDYLGPNNSKIRRAISYILDRVSRKMKNADGSGSLESWQEILEE